jgi:hypothetical protein
MVGPAHAPATAARHRELLTGQDGIRGSSSASKRRQAARHRELLTDKMGSEDQGARVKGVQLPREKVLFLPECAAYRRLPTVAAMPSSTATYTPPKLPKNAVYRKASFRYDTRVVFFAFCCRRDWRQETKFRYSSRTPPIKAADQFSHRRNPAENKKTVP